VDTALGEHRDDGDGNAEFGEQHPAWRRAPLRFGVRRLKGGVCRGAGAGGRTPATIKARWADKVVRVESAGHVVPSQPTGGQPTTCNRVDHSSAGDCGNCRDVKAVRWSAGYLLRGNLDWRRTRERSVPSLAGFGLGVCLGLRTSRPRLLLPDIANSMIVGTVAGGLQTTGPVKGGCLDPTRD